MVRAVIDSGVDTAISLQMEIDQGAVQPIEIIYGNITAKPVISVFINSVASPFTPIARIRALGQTIGEILASGDLSPLDGWAPDWME